MNIEFSLDATTIKEYGNKSMIYDTDVLMDKFKKSIIDEVVQYGK